jgi:hypothetical protein
MVRNKVFTFRVRRKGTVMIKDTKEKLIGHNRKKKMLEKYQYGNV